MNENFSGNFFRRLTNCILHCNITICKKSIKRQKILSCYDEKQLNKTPKKPTPEYIFLFEAFT